MLKTAEPTIVPDQKKKKISLIESLGQMEVQDKVGKIVLLRVRGFVFLKM